MEPVAVADYYIRWIPVVIGNIYLATKTIRYNPKSPLAKVFQDISALSILCGSGVMLWLLAVSFNNDALLRLLFTLGTIIIHIGLSFFWILIWRLLVQTKVPLWTVIITMIISNTVASIIYILDATTKTPPTLLNGIFTQNTWLFADVVFSLGFLGMFASGIVFLRVVMNSENPKRKVAALSHAVWMLTLSTFFIVHPYVSRTGLASIFYVFVASFFITSLLLILRLERITNKDDAHA